MRDRLPRPGYLCGGEILALDRADSDEANNMIIGFRTHFHEGQGRIEDILSAVGAQGVDVAGRLHWPRSQVLDAAQGRLLQYRLPSTSRTRSRSVAATDPGSPG